MLYTYPWSLEFEYYYIGTFPKDTWKWIAFELSTDKATVN
jgi:hypothetical protein